MNAIKLRPRQVLCDNVKGLWCKGTSVRHAEAPFQTAEVTMPKDGVMTAQRQLLVSGPVVIHVLTRRAVVLMGPNGRVRLYGCHQPPPLLWAHSQVKGAAAGKQNGEGGVYYNHVHRSSAAQCQKVLQSKNVDHSKAREVLKMAKAQSRQRETVTGSSGNTKAITRAAALQEAHQKVHFTRRLQQISGGGPGSKPLPPRMRIKPQRYRNEENDSSSCKLPCLEKVPGGGRLLLPKPALPRCTSTRSSSSSSCSASQVTTAVEPQRPEKAIESLLSQAKPESLPAPEYREPQAEPEEQEGREEKRETRGSKAGNLVVYMTLNPSHTDSSGTSMCSVDSADDLKSSNSECSSTETFDFPPPGDLRSAPAPAPALPLAHPLLLPLHLPLLLRTTKSVLNPSKLPSFPKTSQSALPLMAGQFV